jgi:hypothetical protein
MKPPTLRRASVPSSSRASARATASYVTRWSRCWPTTDRKTAFWTQPLPRRLINFPNVKTTSCLLSDVLLNPLTQVARVWPATLDLPGARVGAGIERCSQVVSGGKSHGYPVTRTYSRRVVDVAPWLCLDFSGHDSHSRRLTAARKALTRDARERGPLRRE